MEALLCSLSALLWGRPQHTHPGEEFSSWMDWTGAGSLGRDLFSLYTHIHLPFFPLPQVRCSDYDSDGSHDLIGTFYTSLTQLQAIPVSASPAQGCWGGPKGL